MSKRLVVVKCEQKGCEYSPCTASYMTGVGRSKMVGDTFMIVCPPGGSHMRSGNKPVIVYIGEEEIT